MAFPNTDWDAILLDAEDAVKFQTEILNTRVVETFKKGRRGIRRLLKEFFGEGMPKGVQAFVGGIPPRAQAAGSGAGGLHLVGRG